MEPAFDLSRFRGRRLRVRFLAASFKVGGVVTLEQIFAFIPEPGDDGWFIDDVAVRGALTDPPATIQVDTHDASQLPTCDARSCDARSCGEAGGVQAAVALDPPSGVIVPGQGVELDASGSTVDVCKQGALEYRFWVKGDGGRAAGRPRPAPRRPGLRRRRGLCG